MKIDLKVVQIRCHELLEQIHAASSSGEASKQEFDRILKEMLDNGEDPSFILRHCIDFLHNETRHVLVLYAREPLAA